MLPLLGLLCWIISSCAGAPALPGDRSQSATPQLTPRFSAMESTAIRQATGATAPASEEAFWQAFHVLGLKDFNRFGAAVR